MGGALKELGRKNNMAVLAIDDRCSCDNQTQPE